MAITAFNPGRRLTLLGLALTIVGLLGSAFLGLRELDGWHRHQLTAWRVGTWFTEQAQTHLLRLMVDLDDFSHGTGGVDLDAVLLQFELVWSRIDVLQGEEVASFFVDSQAVDRFVDDSGRDLAAVEPWIAGLKPDDPSALRQAKEHLGALARRLADLSIALNRERVAALQDMDGRATGLLARFLATMAGVVIAGGVLVGLLVQATRLQDRHLRQSRRAELRAAEAEQDLRIVIDALPAIVSATDREGRRLFANRFHASFFGSGPAPAEARDAPAFREEVTVDGRGETRVLLATEVPVVASDGSIDRTVRIALDITARKRAEDRVRYLAERDVLTGLPNRATLMTQLEVLLARDPGREPLALLLVDLDDFKAVNDTLGHAAGDALLMQWTERLRAFLVGRDALACRLGGDEFAVLATSVVTEAQALELAEQLQQRLAEHFVVSGTTVRVGASIGIAMAPQDGSTAPELLRHADVALYAAKRSGRRRSQLFTGELATQHQHRKLLEAGLRDALGGIAGLWLEYQPKHELASGRLAGFEALLRWTHPSLGPIAPALFIPIAEETGLIGAVGRWVIDQTIRQIALWDRDGIGAGVTVAVNFSAAQLVDRDVVAATMAAVEAAGIAPSRLKVEVTETTLMRDIDHATETLARFRAHGIGVAIDDFGTGFSSLSFLLRLPFDELKIDRSFVQAMRDSPAALAVVRAVVGLAKSLGAVVVAEGIETREQLSQLRELGCDQGQGYLLGRPAPPLLAAETMRRSTTWAGRLPPPRRRPTAAAEPSATVALAATLGS